MAKLSGLHPLIPTTQTTLPIHGPQPTFTPSTPDPDPPLPSLDIDIHELEENLSVPQPLSPLPLPTPTHLRPTIEDGDSDDKPEDAFNPASTHLNSSDTEEEDTTEYGSGGPEDSPFDMFGRHVDDTLNEEYEVLVSELGM